MLGIELKSSGRAAVLLVAEPSLQAPEQEDKKQAEENAAFIEIADPPKRTGDPHQEGPDAIIDQ